jgi:hypothetical protein
VIVSWLHLASTHLRRLQTVIVSRPALARKASTIAWSVIAQASLWQCLACGEFTNFKS